MTVIDNRHRTTAATVLAGRAGHSRTDIMMQSFRFGLLWGGMLLLAAIAGCGRSGTQAGPEVEPPRQRPLRGMESAVRRGQWQEAATFIDQVLELHGDEPEAVAQAARVVFENGDTGRAAKLLVQTCRLESFANAMRTRQATVAMIGEGRFHEGMALLAESIAVNPDQPENRRWLYDFYMGAEDRYAGLPHGRFLVQQRAFDVELLTSLSNTERRTLDSKPLLEMMARNPDDKRPLMGPAKSKFDKGEFEGCIGELREILAAHPDYFPAHALLGRALATDGRFQDLVDWMNAATDGIEAYPEYWVAVGDWLRSEERPAQAARAYWEAARRDADWMEPWSKLGSTIESLPERALVVSDETVTAVRSRAERLSRFNLLKLRFERTGKISRATVIEMVEVLRDLGRLWEAEAWASIALGLPEDDAVDVEATRNSIVTMLSKDTPWQVVDPFPELQMDLSHVPLDPLASVRRRLEQEAGSEPHVDARLADAEASVVNQDASHISLQDEAVARGLDFFGRTSDHLNEPGIMIYQTLGCGGGTIDFDRDGWSDLYLAAAGGMPPAKDSAPNMLVRNVGGRFVDVTATSQTGDRGFGQGVAVGDVNEDGFPDLLVLNYGPNSLLINNGDGTFRDQSAILPDNGDSWSTSGAIADLDGDGLSDIVIVNYCAGLEPTTVICVTSEETFVPSCSPVRFDAERDQFLHATAEGTLIDQTDEWVAVPSVPGRGLGIIAGSFDATPGIDVLIANDMTNNHLWSGVATGNGFKLTESGMLRGLATDDRAMAQGSMGIASGDLDNDGDLDFYVTNFNGEYSTYHGQQSGGIWRDETARWNLGTPTFFMVGFGTAAVDLDRDSMLELTVANGHVDLFSRGLKSSPYAQPFQVFRRNSTMKYDSVGESMRGEYVTTPHVGRALWTIDVDRDARVDLAVTHQTEPVALLINHSTVTGRWLEISLVATRDSRDAIGATVQVTVNDQSWLSAQVSGDGYLCSDERILRFGLGEIAADATAEIEVTWADGQSERFTDLPVDASWLIVQGESEPFTLTR